MKIFKDALYGLSFWIRGGGLKQTNKKIYILCLKISYLIRKKSYYSDDLFIE